MKNKWIPKFFYKKYDGGKESGVIGYFLIEWKPVFSIGLLKFNKGSRENYHSHAFNALTWWLKGLVKECKLNASFDKKNNLLNKYGDIENNYYPSLIPKYTTRSNIHKVFAFKDTWAITLRGSWKDTWKEFNPQTNKVITLTHGRQIINNGI